MTRGRAFASLMAALGVLGVAAYVGYGRSSAPSGTGAGELGFEASSSPPDVLGRVDTSARTTQGAAPLASSPSSETAPPVKSDAPSPASSAADSSIARVKAAKQDPTERGTQALIAALSDADPIAVVEAADGLVARRSRAGALALTTVDVRRSGELGPEVIDAMGKMSAADPTVRSALVTHLLDLLAQEKSRLPAPDAAANLLELYEALGESGDPAAAPALEVELEDPTVGMAAKVEVAKSLEHIGAERSALALRRELQLLVGRTEPDDFAEQVRVELVSALREAITALGR